MVGTITLGTGFTTLSELPSSHLLYSYNTGGSLTFTISRVTITMTIIQMDVSDQ